MKRALLLLAALAGTTANAVPFTLTITNTATTTDYDWAPGLLTLSPLIALGPTPQPPSLEWATYRYANSNCPVTEEGNATLLASRWGLVMSGPGTNAWLIPNLLANGGSHTLTIDVPVGARLSYIAWVSSTAVFDDFVAMHPPGDLTTLSVPLFNGSVPVENIDFDISGYDVNSTSPTDGSGATCTAPSECPTATTGCFVAPGNASSGGGGSFPVPPTPNVRTLTASTSIGQNRLWWTNVGPHQGVVIARSTSTVTFVPATGVTYTAGQNLGGTAATGIINADREQDILDGETFTLNDGTGNPAVIFAFDKNSSPTPGATRVNLSGGGNSNASQVAAVIRTAINSVMNQLRIVAGGSGAQVTLTNELTGIAGNVAITETVSNGGFTVSGMANGTDGATTIVYADNGAGAASSFIDTTGAAGTRYFYKVFSHANTLRYSNGSVPGTQGLFSEVTSSSGSSPKWCYSVGFASLQQPVTSLGATVFTSNASGTVTANITSPGNAATDGNERWRPVQLGGTTQSRPLMVPTQIGNLLITGDFSGSVTAINPATGAIVWTSPVLGSRVQGQPVAQLLNFVGSFGAAGTAFAAANPGRDLIFVGTRNTGSTTNNKAYALNSTNGAIVWTYAPNNLDYISGGMAVDYARNRVYVGAHNGLRVLNSLDGVQVASLLAGQQLDHGVNLDFGGGSATSVYTVSFPGGVAHGIDLATMTPTFSSAIGQTSSWIFPTGNGFIAPMSTGAIRRYSVSGATVTQLWERAGIGVPAGATIDYPNAKIYTGTSTGTLRQIDFNDGGLDRTLTVTSIAPAQIGFPTLDTTVGRLHVGTMDGRLCAFPIPLP